jgi:hypothetical protein
VGITKKKIMRKASSKKLKKHDTVVVFKTIVPAKETLFPEKLKKANELLKEVKWMEGW